MSSSIGSRETCKIVSCKRFVYCFSLLKHVSVYIAGEVRLFDNGDW